MGLDDLLLGLGEIGLRLTQVVLLLSGIELDDVVAGFDQLAGPAEKGDGHAIDARHGGDEHLGIAALQLSARGDGDDDAAAFDPGDGKLGGGGAGSGDADEPHRAPGGGAQDEDDDGGNQQAQLHFFASWRAASTSVTSAPAGMPETATSSGLRAST